MDKTILKPAPSSGTGSPLVLSGPGSTPWGSRFSLNALHARSDWMIRDRDAWSRSSTPSVVPEATSPYCAEGISTLRASTSTSVTAVPPSAAPSLPRRRREPREEHLNGSEVRACEVPQSKRENDMFEVGNRIRTNRSANVRYGVIERIYEDGAVLGRFDDGTVFIRDTSVLDDIVLAAD